MDDSNPHEIIPITFTSQPETSKYLIQTRSQAKSSGIKLLEIHSANKGLNPHVKPGRQRPLSTLPTNNIPPTLLVQPVG